MHTFRCKQKVRYSSGEEQRDAIIIVSQVICPKCGYDYSHNNVDQAEALEYGKPNCCPIWDGPATICTDMRAALSFIRRA